MKKVVKYTSDEHAQFSKIYEFLNLLTSELDDLYELTNEREKLIDYAITAIQQVENFFND